MYLKLYPLLSVVNRHSVSVEFQHGKNRLIDLQAKVMFKSDFLRGRLQFIPNVAFLNDGAELLVGFNKIKHRDRKPSFVRGFYFSYRYQHISNGYYYPDVSGGSGQYFGYHFSQTKNMIGFQYKLALADLKSRFSLDSYLLVGFYTGVSRTLVFYLDPSHGMPTNNGGIMNPEKLAMPNGFFVLPHITLGFCPRIKVR